MKLTVCFVTFLFILSPSKAGAVTIAVCGGSSGFTYFLPGGLVAPDSAGWQEDGISTGRITLILDDENYDMVLGDVTGSTWSARARGARVIPITDIGYLLSLLVVYTDGTTESYLFKLGPDAAEVVWTQTKANDLISKASVFVSKCDVQ